MILLKRTAIPLLGLLLAAAGLAAQQPGVITGTVTDSATGEPLAGVLVERGPSWALTAADGRFALAGDRGGRVAVTARRAGHRPTLVPAVPAGARNLRITLVALPLTLDAVVVSVARIEQAPFDAPASVSVIGGDEAREHIALTSADLVRGVPGVDMASKGLLQHTWAMRGFLGAASDALLVLTDFRPAAVPSIRFNIPYLVPGTSDDIERIEVQRGPGAALYGPGADRGVVNVVTRSPIDSRGGHISITSGTRDVRDFSGRWSVGGRRLGFKFSGSWFRGRDWPFADTTAAFGAHPIAERASGDVRADWRIDARTEAVFSAGLASAVRVADLTPAGPFQLRNWHNGYLQARLRRGGTFVNIAWNGTDAGDTYSLQSGDTLRDRSRQLLIQAQRQLAAGRRSLVVGADLRLTDPRTYGTIHGRFEDSDDVREAGAFATGSVALTPSFELVGALRVDHHDRLDGTALSPRAGVIYRASPSQTLRLTLNRAWVTPSSATLFADFAAGALDPSLPYGLRVAGIPREGFQFNPACGGPCMHSPFDPAGPATARAADANGAWPAVVALLQSQSIDISGVPAPTPAEVASGLALVGDGGFAPFTGTLADIGANGRELTSVLELGYKGLIGERTLVTLDVYRTRVSNVLRSLEPVTPNLFLDSATLAQYLAPAVGAGNADQIAGLVSQVPIGTVTPSNAPHPTDILVISRQGGTYGLWGADLAIESQLSRRLSVTGSMSWASRDSAPGIALGIPRQKASAAFQWRGSRSRVEIRGRALTSYPVASGMYRGRIRAYGVADVTVGRQAGRVDLTISAFNVFDHRHAEFPLGPRLGRMLMLRVGAAL